MPELDAFGTHLAPLLAAVAKTSGAVLECGSGHYSTALLHALCEPRGRSLLTLEHNTDWLREFTYLRTENHRIEQVPDWTQFPWASILVDVALVDHDIRRGPVIKELRHRAKYLVIHDTDADCTGVGDSLESFDWVWTYDRYPTWASLCGMGQRPDWIERTLPPGKWGVPKPYR